MFIAARNTALSGPPGIPAALVEKIDVDGALGRPGGALSYSSIETRPSLSTTVR